MFEPGKNCYKVAHADRAAVLIDGKAYFDAFKLACQQARSHIIIAGWDLDFYTPLHPGLLGPFLHELLAKNRQLKLFLLTWDYSAVYARERGLWSSRTKPWQFPRVTLCLDDAHPFGGSQHQKLVVIDDTLAFCGGFDLSQARWDTPEHSPDERHMDDGRPYGSFHDVQMMVSGDAAKTLGEIARHRWLRATGKHIRIKPAHAQWPDLGADFEDVQIAIARTVPAFDGAPEVREVQQLYADSIAKAQRLIYIENQYLTSAFVRDQIIASLHKPTGPQICIVGPAAPTGWLEQATMGVLRARLIQRLRAADTHGRLKLFSPMRGDEALNVHSKVMIVDDAFLRIGSSNLSNRSMGFDTECDLALQADVTSVRVRLLSEHLGAPLDASAPLFESIARINGGFRRLEEVPDPDPSLLERILPEQALFDFEAPVEETRAVDTLLRGSNNSVDRRPFMIATVFLLLLAAIAAAWRLTPLATLLEPGRISAAVAWLQAQPLAPLLLAGTFALAAVLLIPLTLLIIQSGLLLGAKLGIAVSLLGAFAGISIGFAIGRIASKRLLLRIAGDRWRRLERLFRKNAVLSVALVRVFPIAPFTVVNVVGGASPCSYASFVAGSLLGITPGVIALSLFGRGIYDLLVAPNWRDAVIIAVVVLCVFGAGRMLKGRLHK